MSVVRYQPVVRGRRAFPSEVDRVFASFFGAPAAPAAAFRRWVPAVDLIETEGDYVLKADLPGVKQDDVKVELEGDVLTVSGERASETEAREGGVVRVERSSGAFRRSVRVPKGVDPEAVAASFVDGVLEVRVPKPEAAQPHRVAITVGTERPAVTAAPEPADAEAA